MDTNIISLIPADISGLLAYQKDSIVSKVIFKSNNLDITLFSVAKGQEFSPHVTTQKAIVHIIEGKGKFMLKKKWFDFNGGEYFYMSPKLLHALKASSNFKFILYLLS